MRFPLATIFAKGAVGNKLKSEHVSKLFKVVYKLF